MSKPYDVITERSRDPMTSSHAAMIVRSRTRHARAPTVEGPRDAAARTHPQEGTKTKPLRSVDSAEPIGTIFGRLFRSFLLNISARIRLLSETV